MTVETERCVTHDIVVAAPASATYAFIADVTRWPVIFTPTVHVEILEHNAGEEVMRIWATANDTVKEWTSKRVLRPDLLRVEFNQQRSAPPVASMGGTWTVRPQGPNSCLVSLDHRYRAINDDAASLEWIDRAVDGNSRTELASLKAAAERDAHDDQLLLTFTDSVDMAARREDVYDFLYQADRWPDRLPHVAHTDVVETGPNVQVLDMVTTTPSGDSHATRSVRVGFRPDRLVYKQQVLPALLSAHIGAWTLRAHNGGIRVSSAHTVLIKPDTIATVLGPDATIETARSFVRKAIGGNSLTTLRHAKEFTENTDAAARANRG